MTVNAHGRVVSLKPESHRVLKTPRAEEWINQKANLAIAHALPAAELALFASLEALPWNEKPSAYRALIKQKNLFGANG